MKFLVDNLLFYPMALSSSLVLWSSYFSIASCWVHTCRTVHQSVLEFSEWTRRVTSTEQGRGVSPLHPIGSSVCRAPREDGSAHVHVCFRPAGHCLRISFTCVSCAAAPWLEGRCGVALSLPADALATTVRRGFCVAHPRRHPPGHSRG